MTTEGRMTSLRLLEILQNPGPDAVFDLLEAIFGPLEPADGIPAEVLDGLRMPTMLRRYYARAGRKNVHRQNYLLTPDKTQQLGSFRLEERPGDRLLIYVENQGSWSWATSHEGDDPPVWVEGSEIDGRRIAVPRLSLFLLQAVMVELPFTAPAVAHRDWPLPADELAGLLAKFVPVASWPEPYGFRFLANDDVVVVADGFGYVSLCAADNAPIEALGLEGPWWGFSLK
jgi:hypothetical protein